VLEDPIPDRLLFIMKPHTDTHNNNNNNNDNVVHICYAKLKSSDALI